MLLQVDGSRHDWLEGRGPWLSLIGGIDDATDLVPWACFREQEDAQGYFQLLCEVLRRRGIPPAVYIDQHSIFYSTSKTPTLEEQLTGQRTPTQVGRRLEELGVRWIRARSPQAEGRVERLWEHLSGPPDQRTPARRCRHARAGQRGARALSGPAQPSLCRPAADPTSAWVAWPPGRPFSEFFCFKYRRVVANDNTIRLGAAVIDLPPKRQRIGYARARVVIHERFDGTLHVFYDGNHLASASPSRAQIRTRHGHRLSPEESPLEPPAIPTIGPKPVSRQMPWRPAANHPWRR